MYHRFQLTGRRAFTLIELLVVITIVGILVAIALPLLSRVQKKGYETKTLSNMRVMGVALMAFAGDNSYQLPGRVPPPTNGTPVDKWPVVLQPYVQDLNVYGAPVPDVGGTPYKVANPPKPGYPQIYLSSDTNYTTYIYNGGNDSAPAGTSALGTAVTYPRLNVIAMPSQTILLGIPQPQKDNFYMDFEEKNNSSILNKAAFPDGTPYIFADGSARTLSVDPKGTPTTNKTQPTSSSYYSDWLWLFDKNRTDVIQ